MPTTGEWANGMPRHATARRQELAVTLPDIPRRKARGDTPALARVIETDIIPRLLNSHRRPDGEKTAPTVSQQQVTDFTAAVLDNDAAVSRLLFRDRLASGNSVRELFERLLVPAAIQLGEMWDQDVCDFVEVARGMDHIQQIVLAQSSIYCAHGAAGSRRVLLAALPGERHRLGLSLIRAELWREGWDVVCEEFATLSELKMLLSTARFDAVGLSASRIDDPHALGLALAGVRRTSLNKRLVIIAGGYAFQNDPRLKTAIGADASPASAREAVHALRRLLDGTQAASPELASSFAAL